MSETKFHYIRWGEHGTTYTLDVPVDISKEAAGLFTALPCDIPPPTTDVWPLRQSKNRLLKLEVPMNCGWDELRKHAAKRLGIDVKDAYPMSSRGGTLSIGDPESFDIDEPDFTPDMPSGVK